MYVMLLVTQVAADIVVVALYIVNGNITGCYCYYSIVAENM